MEKKVILIARADLHIPQYLKNALTTMPDGDSFEILLANNTQDALEVIAESAPVLVVSGLFHIDWKALTEAVGIEKMLIWSTETLPEVPEEMGKISPRERSPQNLMEIILQKASRE